MVEKCFKKLIVITYTNKVHIYFQRLIVETPKFGLKESNVG